MAIKEINIVHKPDLSSTLEYSGFETHKIPVNVRYVFNKTNYDGITLFLDNCFNDINSIKFIEQFKSKYKFGWLHEPRALHDVQKHRCALAEIAIEDNCIDLLLTHDNILLEKFPNKTKFAVDNGVWILPENIGIHPKDKLISMIYSNKGWTEGHQLRHMIANYATGIDLYGSGANKPIENKDIGIINYKYSIAIENSRTNHYFTEKLLDCLSVGTIPIYWGCPNIGKYFDERGIIQIKEIDDLNEVFEIISNENHYNSLMPYIQNNFNLVREYICREDWMYNKIFKQYD